MASHDIDLVDLDLAVQNDLGEFRDQPLAQVPGHHLNVVLIQSQFPGDLPVRQVQAHEIQAQHPNPERLVVARQNCPGQIVEAFPAAVAQVALPVPLGVVTPVAHHFEAAAFGALNATGPAMTAHHLETLRVINQKRQVDGIGHGTGPEAATGAPSNQPFNALDRP